MAGDVHLLTQFHHPWQLRPQPLMLTASPPLLLPVFLPSVYSAKIHWVPPVRQTALGSGNRKIHNSQFLLSGYLTLG